MSNRVHPDWIPPAKASKAAGVKMKGFLHSNRPYDMIAICEAPDDKDDRKGACSGNFFPVDRESDILPTAYAHFGMAARRAWVRFFEVKGLSGKDSPFGQEP